MSDPISPIEASAQYNDRRHMLSLSPGVPYGNMSLWLLSIHPETGPGAESDIHDDPWNVGKRLQERQEPL